MLCYVHCTDGGRHAGCTSLTRQTALLCVCVCVFHQPVSFLLFLSQFCFQTRAKGDGCFLRISSPGSKQNENNVFCSILGFIPCSQYLSVKDEAGMNKLGGKIEVHSSYNKEEKHPSLLVSVCCSGAFRCLLTQMFKKSNREESYFV